jgi:hypothetical protein
LIIESLLIGDWEIVDLGMNPSSNQESVIAHHQRIDNQKITKSPMLFSSLRNRRAGV